MVFSGIDVVLDPHRLIAVKRIPQKIVHSPSRWRSIVVAELKAKRFARLRIELENNLAIAIVVGWAITSTHVIHTQKRNSPICSKKVRPHLGGLQQRQAGLNLAKAQYEEQAGWQEDRTRTFKLSAKCVC